MKYIAKKRILILIGLSLILMIYLNLRMHLSRNSYSMDSINFFSYSPVAIIVFQKTDSSGLATKNNIFNTNGILLNTNTSNDIHTYSIIKNILNVTYFTFKPIEEFKNYWKKKPYINELNIPQPELFKKWKPERVCNNQLTLYANNFVLAHDIGIDRTNCHCDRKGGESLSNVIMQSEDSEFYTFGFGCFMKTCSVKPSYHFGNNNHLNDWMSNLKTKDLASSYFNDFTNVDDFTIAITRYEYANLYHTMTDWYNAFLLKEFFNKTSFETNILLVDAHPYGALDPVWSHLFNSTKRLSTTPLKTVYRNFVWGILGYNSPLGISVTAATPPLLEEFRRFFLDSYGLNDAKGHNCTKFNILFIWRRDYLAHPRNPSGLISRKIANEAGLLNYLKLKLPSNAFAIRDSQIDILDMRDQLKHILWADILVGMHGAGLTHTLFLRKNAALIELSPNYYSGDHFKAISHWRQLAYSSWKNDDVMKELPNQSTIIPPAILITLIKQSVKNLCSIDQYRNIFPLSSEKENDFITPITN